MAQQISKKFIKNDAIDGDKIKLLENQAVRAVDENGDVVELLKYTAEGVLVTGSAIAFASDVEAEATARESADLVIEGRLDTIEADYALKTYVDTGDANTLSSAQSYADQKVADLVNSAPETLDTLKELAEALGEDPNFATTIANQLGSLDQKIDGEITARGVADTALDSRLIALEGLSESQIVYVSKSGSDSTGTGGQHRHFASITAALNSIADASPTKRYVIKVAAGNYTEAALALKANVFIIGDSHRTSRVTGPVTMAADFTGSADHRSGFANITLLSAVDFNWQTVTSAAGKIYCESVLFNTTVNMYGHNNAIAQSSFIGCQFFGAITISGINVGTFMNNFCHGSITLNQHPNGGMVSTIVATGGQCNGTVTLNAATNDFNRRCSMFAKNFYMEYVTINGPSAYIDMNEGSVPRSRDRIVSQNGGNVVYITAKAPHVSNANSIGEVGYQYLYNFAYVHASTDTDLYVISMGNAYSAANAGRSIFIESDSYGLAANVNGGDINLATATTSGTGVRGKIKLQAREIEVASKITGLLAGVVDTDAVNKGQMDQAIAGLVNSAPEVLDTLKELSDALGGDANFATTIAGQIGSIDLKIDGEITDRGVADTALQSQIDSLDGRVGDLEIKKEIIEIDSLGDAPTVGLEGNLYVTKDDNKLYRWATIGGGSLTFDKVVGSGEEYETLQDALAAAIDGENILVKPGTYAISSSIAVNKQVKIVGEDRDLVIFQTDASTSAPTSMFNVSADNVALAKMTIKHRKTSNTSIETAVVVSGPGFPQTRVSNFVMEDCSVEFLEFGASVRCDSWCIRNTTFVYATGTVSNSCRAIGIYGNKGDSFIKDVFLKNDVLNGTAFRPFYLTSTTGTNPNETTEGKLVVEGTTHVGPLAQFFNQDNQQSAGDGTFELQIKNNVINESNLFAGFAAGVANSGNMFSSVTLSGNTLSNLHAIDGGKGVFGVYGTAEFRNSPLIVHALNNTLGQEVYRTGWVSVEGTTVGKETGTPSFVVSLDSVIPASGDAPFVSPGPASSYVEVSSYPDLSDEIEGLDSRIEALESEPNGPFFHKKKVVISDNVSYIDLDHTAIDNSLIVTVGRLVIHLGEDFSASVVDGKTRLTWTGDFATGGLEAIEAGDVIFATYAVN